MDLLSFLNKCIELRDAFEREIIHEIYLVRVAYEFFFKIFHRNWKCSWKEANLALGRAMVHEFLQEWFKLWRQKLVRLVHDDCVAATQRRNAFLW